MGLLLLLYRIISFSILFIAKNNKNIYNENFKLFINVFYNVYIYDYYYNYDYKYKQIVFKDEHQ